MGYGADFQVNLIQIGLRADANFHDGPITLQRGRPIEIGTVAGLRPGSTIALDDLQHVLGADPISRPPAGLVGIKAQFRIRRQPANPHAHSQGRRAGRSDPHTSGSLAAGQGSPLPGPGFCHRRFQEIRDAAIEADLQRPARRFCRHRYRRGRRSRQIQRLDRDIGFLGAGGSRLKRGAGNFLDDARRLDGGSIGAGFHRPHRLGLENRRRRFPGESRFAGEGGVSNKQQRDDRRDHYPGDRDQGKHGIDS